MAPPRFADRDLSDRRVAADRSGADDLGMRVIALPPTAPAGSTMRCECAACGAHVTVRRSWQISGQCGNCRSYDLRALAPVPAPQPPASAPSLVDLQRRLPVAFPQTRVA